MSDQYGQRFKDIDIMKGREDGWDIEVVAASDYDRLTAENKRLAESVAELTKASEHWLQDRNAVADHRDRLAAALRECVDSDLRHSECVTFPGNCSACIAIEHAEAALAGTAAHETLATAQRDNLEAGTADLGKSPESQSGYDSPKFVKSLWHLASDPPPECNDVLIRLKTDKYEVGYFWQKDWVLRGVTGGQAISTSNVTHWRELPAAPEGGDVSAWQPIKTAPKDRLISVWVDGDEIREGFMLPYAYYDAICDQWRTSRPSGHLYAAPWRLVNHWREIPEGPADTNSEHHQGDDK